MAGKSGKGKRLSQIGGWFMKFSAKKSLQQMKKRKKQRENQQAGKRATAQRECTSFRTEGNCGKHGDKKRVIKQGRGGSMFRVSFPKTGKGKATAVRFLWGGGGMGVPKGNLSNT